MSKVAVGSIPKKISYVYSNDAEVAVGCSWDINWYEPEDDTEDDSPQTVKQKVTPSFPVDSADAKGMARAKDWAGNNAYNWDNGNKVNKTVKVDEVENEPITDVKVLSLEERGNGGRAYKALIGRYYVDLREDVLMDTLLQVGVDPGGVLKGEYVWAKMGPQMKLVRVGSELHRLVTEFDSKKDIKPVSKGDLEVGGVYQDRKKNKAIFVGYVSTVTYKSTNPEPYYRRTNDKADFKYKQTVAKKAMLFYELSPYTKMEQSIKNMKNKDNEYYYKIKKSHSYIEKTDQVVILDGVVDYLREKAVKEVKSKILEYTGHKAPEKNFAKINAAYLENHIEYLSDHLNLNVYGAAAIEPFDVKKFLLFS
jgi:hypothetical protein